MSNKLIVCLAILVIAVVGCAQPAQPSSPAAVDNTQAAADSIDADIQEIKIEEESLDFSDLDVLEQDLNTLI